MVTDLLYMYCTACCAVTHSRSVELILELLVEYKPTLLYQYCSIVDTCDLRKVHLIRQISMGALVQVINIPSEVRSGLKTLDRPLVRTYRTIVSQLVPSCSPVVS
jgi:hypothetical protein